uniref:Cytochrome P450 n=1 Tax=Phaedon brassicae TaxID=154011 RepID=A0A9Y1LQG6_9CUCU|nr:cytochrome P450 [Phaedon brassicae]
MLSRQVIRFLLLNKCSTRSASGSALDFRDLPEPKGLPLVGTTLSLLAAGGPAKLHEYINGRHEKLGPIFKDNVGPVTAVFLSDPDEMRAVFAKEGKYPIHIKPESWLIYNEKFGCSRGLFFMDGEEWLHFRRIMNKLLLKGDLSWIEDSCDVASQLLIDTIKANTKQELPNVEDTLYKWSLDVIVSILVGKRTYQQYHKEMEPLVQNLAATIHLVFRTTSKMQLLPARLAEKYQLTRWKNFEKSVNDALGSAYKMLDYLQSNFGETDGLLAKMIHEEVPKKELDRIVVDLILGAGDTTAYSMAWILFAISKHTEVQHELRRQLRSDEKTHLLKNVVRETLRLYPVAPFLTRIIPEEVVVCGYTIPANTLIVMSIYTSGRSEKYFKDPNTFIPDRWLRNGSAGSTAIQQASLPFGMGSRSCIGKKIAETQFQMTLKKVVENFHVEIRNADQIENVMQMVSKPSKPLKLQFNKI